MDAAFVDIALDHEQSSYQSRFYGVVFDRCCNTEIFGLIAYPVIRTPPAKRHDSDHIRLARGKALHGLQQTARTDLGKQQDVHMIRRYDKRA